MGEIPVINEEKHGKLNMINLPMNDDKQRRTVDDAELQQTIETMTSSSSFVAMALVSSALRVALLRSQSDRIIRVWALRERRLLNTSLSAASLALYRRRYASIRGCPLQS